jgi:hypothetical protein
LVFRALGGSRFRPWLGRRFGAGLAGRLSGWLGYRFSAWLGCWFRCGLSAWLGRWLGGMLFSVLGIVLLPMLIGMLLSVLAFMLVRMLMLMRRNFYHANIVSLPDLKTQPRLDILGLRLAAYGLAQRLAYDFEIRRSAFGIATLRHCRQFILARHSVLGDIDGHRFCRNGRDLGCVTVQEVNADFMRRVIVHDFRVMIPGVDLND